MEINTTDIHVQMGRRY